jgi:prepilin-type N-terminal cleavage/methylation domain-containing protein
VYFHIEGMHRHYFLRIQGEIMKKHRIGFTLIELLIVVAIIAILAAIAVPNFLEAQVRSKVSRVKADMRTVATGVESYCVDNNKYPPAVEAGVPYMWGDLGQPPYTFKTSSVLTTPIAYLSSLPADVFFTQPGVAPPPPVPQSMLSRFFYVNMDYMNANPTMQGPNVFRAAGQNGGIWMLFSVGPDKNEFNRFNIGPPEDDKIFRDYDPTNGTVSLGNVFRTHKGGDKIGYLPELWLNP